MNFLRYPLTSKNFFLNQKNPHRVKFLRSLTVTLEQGISFKEVVKTFYILISGTFTVPNIGEVHPEPHPLQGSNEPYTDNVYPTDAVGLEHLKGKIPLDHLYIERR